MDRTKKTSALFSLLRHSVTKKRMFFEFKISLSPRYIQNNLPPSPKLFFPSWTVTEFSAIYSKVMLVSHPALESSLGNGMSERSDLNIATMLSIQKMIQRDIKFRKAVHRITITSTCEQPSCQRLKGALLQNGHYVRKKIEEG